MMDCPLEAEFIVGEPLQNERTNLKVAPENFTKNTYANYHELKKKSSFLAILLTRLTRKDANTYVLIVSCHFCDEGRCHGNIAGKPL